MWRNLPAGLKTTFSLSLYLMFVSLLDFTWRGSEVVLRHGVSVTKQMKCHRETDWSSDDVTSSWGWRQEEVNSLGHWALPCPSKCFHSSALRLHQSIPDLLTIIRYPSCFYFYYLILHFIPKPNYKLSFFFFFKWLSRCLSLSLSLSLWIQLVTAPLVFSSCLATGDAPRHA